MSARALHEFTDMLPLLDTSDLTTLPPALGIATVPAMESGLFWGTVGAIRELIEQLGLAGSAISGQNAGIVAAKKISTLTRSASEDPSLALRVSIEHPSCRGDSTPSRPQVFLTGGAGATVAGLLGADARYVPNLTLAGIALAATVE
jgi:pantothenate kinase type III